MVLELTQVETLTSRKKTLSIRQNNVVVLLVLMQHDGEFGVELVSRAVSNSPKSRDRPATGSHVRDCQISMNTVRPTPEGSVIPTSVIIKNE